MKIGKFYRIYDDDLEDYMRSKKKDLALEQPTSRDYGQSGTQLVLGGTTDEEIEKALSQYYDSTSLDTNPLIRFTPITQGESSKGELLRELLQKTFSKLASLENADSLQALLLDYLNMRYRERRPVSEVALKLNYSREHLRRKYHGLAIQIFKTAFFEIVM